MEEWRRYKNSDYFVSNFGRIKTVNYDGSGQERIMSPYDVHGYKRIRIFENKNSRSVGVHRLVAEMFIPNPEDKPFVNHIDGNKSNNNIKNLEWCTPSENSLHAFRMLKIKPHGGRKKKKVRLVETGQTFNSIREASNATGHNRTSIISCCKGRYKSSNKMHWEYVS